MIHPVLKNQLDRIDFESKSLKERTIKAYQLFPIELWKFIIYTDKYQNGDRFVIIDTNLKEIGNVTIYLNKDCKFTKELEDFQKNRIKIIMACIKEGLI